MTMTNPSVLAIADYLYQSDRIYFWVYNADGVLSQTNCSVELLEKMFRQSGSFEYILSEHKRFGVPLVISNVAGYIWAVVFEAEEQQLKQFYVFGPFISTDLNIDELLEQSYPAQGEISPKLKKKLRVSLTEVPNIQVYDFYQHILAVNYILNGTLLGIGDFSVIDQKDQDPNALHRNPLDSRKYYNLERVLLGNIETGNLNYQKDYANYENFYRHHSQYTTSELGSQVVFISLCVRAAIAGGLAPELAFATGARYSNLLSLTLTQTKNKMLLREMYAQFVQMVHDKQNTGVLSKPVSATVDYINAYAEKKLTIHLLADRIGYSDYYLSRRFKNEIGMSINDFIKKAKIDRAKKLLLTTNLSVGSIAESLGFESRSHFVSAFKTFAGQTPTEYRMNG